MAVIAVNNPTAGSQQRVWNGVTYTIGTESGNVIRVTAQCTEGGNNLTERSSFNLYLSSDAEGDGLVGTAPSGGWAIGTAGVFLSQPITNKIALVITDAAGKVDLDLTDTGTPTFYLNIVGPECKMFTSSAITFA